ncbi:MAG: hypothetical protein ACREUZ_00735, partial [Burkholderiales bacterium]
GERVEKSPVAAFGGNGNRDGCPGRNQPGRQDVDPEQSEVVRPAGFAREGSALTWMYGFPKRNRSEDCGEGT